MVFDVNKVERGDRKRRERTRTNRLGANGSSCCSGLGDLKPVCVMAPRPKKASSVPHSRIGAANRWKRLGQL